jgi:hypothetical protein
MVEILPNVLHSVFESKIRDRRDLTNDVFVRLKSAQDSGVALKVKQAFAA